MGGVGTTGSHPPLRPRRGFSDVQHCATISWQPSQSTSNQVLALLKIAGITTCSDEFTHSCRVRPRKPYLLGHSLPPRRLQRGWHSLTPSRCGVVAGERKKPRYQSNEILSFDRSENTTKCSNYTSSELEHGMVLQKPGDS